MLVASKFDVVMGCLDCWRWLQGSCMAGLSERGGRWEIGSSPLEGLLAMSERLWSPAEVRDADCARVRMDAAERLLAGLPPWDREGEPDTEWDRYSVASDG
jgi:hypothetical protein